MTPRYFGTGMTPVVRVLLISTVAVYGIQLISMIAGLGDTMNAWFGASVVGLRQGRFWQALTYMWMHGGPFHLLFNMMSLYFLGQAVEQQAGSRHFLLMYLAGGLAGAALWFCFSSQVSIPLVGASAGICAVGIAFAVFAPRALLYVFPLPFAVEARWFALVSALITIALVIQMPTAGGIAHLAHLGGMIVGFFYAKSLKLTHETLFQLPLPSLPALPSLFQHKSGAAQVRRESGKSEFISGKVDPILDKISREGFQSLTPQERKILDEARRRMQ